MATKNDNISISDLLEKRKVILTEFNGMSGQERELMAELDKIRRNIFRLDGEWKVINDLLESVGHKDLEPPQEEVPVKEGPKLVVPQPTGEPKK